MEESTDQEELTDPGTGEEWHRNEDIELADLCTERHTLAGKIKLHEGYIKRFKLELEDIDKRLQARMDGHKAVRALFGWTLRWVPKTRKAYSVPASSWEQWEVRAPY